MRLFWKVLYFILFAPSPCIFKNRFKKVCVCEWLYACTVGMCTYRHRQRPWALDSLEPELQAVVIHSHGCLEQISDPLQEQYMLLTADPFLKLPSIFCSCQVLVYKVLSYSPVWIQCFLSNRLGSSSYTWAVLPPSHPLPLKPKEEFREDGGEQSTHKPSHYIGLCVGGHTICGRPKARHPKSLEFNELLYLCSSLGCSPFG